eukprot:jgi/Psemu1/293059/fgenesh1_pg.1587_\
MLIANKRTRRVAVIDSMQKAKKQAAEYDSKLEQAARDVLAKYVRENKEVSKLPVHSLKIFYEWKLGKKPKNLKKLDLLAAVAGQKIRQQHEAKTKHLASAVSWNEGGEAKLHRLETKDIEMKDTILGQKTTDQADQSISYLENLSAEQIETVVVSAAAMVIRIKQFQGIWQSV